MMNIRPTDGMILKSDGFGQVETPVARPEQLLDELDRSGLTGLKFAEVAGIKYQTFATWMRPAKMALL